jgi:hypothetical protein
MANSITLDEIMGTAAPTAAPAAPKKAKPITFDDVLGASEIVPDTAAPTRAGPTYGPKVIDPQGDSNFTATFKANLVEDPDTKVRLAAETLFPGDPNGASRVGLVGGRVVKVNDQGQLEYVTDKMGEFGAGMVANSPEMIAGTAGSLSPLPVASSTLGVMGARGLKRAAAGVVFDEPQTIEGNLKNIAQEGAINLVTAGAAKGLTKVADRGRVVDFTPTNLADAQAVQQSVKGRFGIDLNLAQASGDPRLVQMWRYVSKYPGKSAEIADEVRLLQEGQVDEAVQMLLDKVGKGNPSPVLGQAAIDTSKATIAKARKDLSDQVRPLYDEAYAAVPEITDPSILGFLKLPYFDKAFARGQKIAELEGFAVPAGKPDLRSMDYLKRALDDNIEGLSRAGNRQEARALKIRRDEFVAALDALPNQQWQAARKAYAEGMKATVEPLENGVVGLLAKVKDPKAATAAVRVFKDPNIGPGDILKAKQAIISQPGGAEAWDGLTRQWLGIAWNNAQKVTHAGAVRNAPGKFAQAVAGTPADKARLVAALGPERGTLAVDMIEALQQVARTSGENSDTAFMQEISGSFRGTASRTARAVMAPRATMIQSAEDSAIKANTAKIAEALSNPAKVRLLKTVVKMPEGTKKATMLAAILGISSSRAAAGDQTTDDRMPSSATPQ